MSKLAAPSQAVPLEITHDQKNLLQTIEKMSVQHARLAERYEWLEAMINHVPDFIYAKDRAGRFLFANRAVVANNGFTDVEELIGKTDGEIHPHTYADDIDAVEKRVIETGTPDLGVEEARIKGEGWLMMSRVALRDRNGAIIGVVGASRDITARKRAEELMAAQTKLLHDVARGVDLVSFLKDAHLLLERLLRGRIVGFDLECSGNCTIAGPRLEFPVTCRDGSSPGALVVSDLPGEFETGMTEFLAGIAQTVGIAIDRHHDIARIAYLAEHDALTGLPNRTLLDRKLGALLAQDNSPVAVAFVDLDHFKLVNDSLGHAAGDELLKVVAARISQALGGNGLVSRIGGDEFIIAMAAEARDALSRLHTIARQIGEPVSIDGVEMRVTCSIGVASSCDHGRSASELIANADMALYRVKDAGRNDIRLFDPDMADEARHKLTRIEELRRAVGADEFVLHYQPQKHIATGQISGVEALVRWQHPQAGLLPPSAFIPLAEETGLIVEIGEIVLNKACAQLRAWLDAGLPAVRVAVNVSARQFRERSLCETVAAALTKADLDPALLEIEVTESLIMEDVAGAIERMHELKRLGVTLSIDDFGTGYSSLSTLKLFPLSRLKIDRSFIADIPGEAGDMAITAAIIALGHTLDLEVIAEGVETVEQVQFLEKTGCEIFQGYLFSRPLPADDIGELIGGATAPSTLAYRRSQ